MFIALWDIELNSEHHVGAHGEETKLQRKIKYMNDKRKKSINYEKSEISVLF